jgi:hypothetical protein
MLKVQSANSREHLDRMISNTINEKKWAVMEEMAGEVKFPTKFVVMLDHKLQLMTIEHLGFA